MNSNDSIVHQIAESLKAHIFANWHSELYGSDGTLTQAGYVPTALESTFSYVDRNGTTRMFGPSLVQVGRFQDDPLSLSGLLAVPSSYIQIRSNDPAKPESWLHSLASTVDGSNNNAGVKPMWAYELGGGMMWWRRFTIDFTIYTIDSDQTQEESHRLGTAALSYLESLVTSHGINRCSWAWQMRHPDGTTLKDPFGETVLQSIVVNSEATQRGGPDTNITGDYIWDGKINLQVQTNKG